MQIAALCPTTFRPWPSPTVVVDLPSPSGVGVIAVTTTYLPRGRSASTRRIASSVTLAFDRPYSSISSSRSPRSVATSAMGRGVTERAISRSVGNVIESLGSWLHWLAGPGDSRSFCARALTRWGRRRLQLRVGGPREMDEEEGVRQRTDAARNRRDRGRDVARRL